jgi:hypothetical protein
MKRRKRYPDYNIFGEPLYMAEYPTKLLSMNVVEAQALVDLITSHDGLHANRVLYSKRKTKDTCASYDKDNSKVTIYHGYGTVHIILHELAHATSMSHSHKWLKCFKRYLALWESEWNKEFIVTT